MNKFYTETVMKILSQDGDEIQIEPDADGLGCLSLSYHNGQNKPLVFVSMPPEQAILVGEALVRMAQSMLNQKT